MLKPWTIVIALHAIIATATIALGTFQAIRIIRGDRLHKAVGRIWASLMLFVSTSGLFIGNYRYGIDLFLHGLAIWTIISVCAGIYFARKNMIRQHKRFMLGSYFGLLDAFIGVIAVPSRRIPSYFKAYPLRMSLVAIGIIIASGFVVFCVWHYIKRSPRQASA